MKPEFRNMLEKEMLPVPLIEYMESENILDAADLAFYCDSRQQLKDLLIDRVAETRDQRKWLVPLARIHEGASARTTVDAKRKAEGWEDTSLEVPLGGDLVNTLLDQFEQEYRWRPDESELLWDHLLGRLKREKDNDAHTLIDIKRAGSALECGKSPAAKSFSIGGGLTASYTATMGFVRPIPTNYIMVGSPKTLEQPSFSTLKATAQFSLTASQMRSHLSCPVRNTLLCSKNSRACRTSTSRHCNRNTPRTTSAGSTFREKSAAIARCSA